MTARPAKDEAREKNRRRLNRNLDAIARRVPFLGRVLRILLRRNMWIIRLPVAVLLVMGGLLSILPLLAFWMLPVGLMLLAVDLPALRPIIGRAVIIGRRRASKIWRRWSRRG